MDKTGSYEHAARKKQVEESDVPDKFALIKLLREEFGLHGLTGEVLYMPNDIEFIRPDVLVKSVHPALAFELDGEWHGNGDEVTTKPHDIVRAWKYKEILAYVRPIIINKALTNGYQTDKVIEVLEANGLKRRKT